MVRVVPEGHEMGQSGSNGGFCPVSLILAWPLGSMSQGSDPDHSHISLLGTTQSVGTLVFFFLQAILDGGQTPTHGAPGQSHWERLVRLGVSWVSSSGAKISKGECREGAGWGGMECGYPAATKVGQVWDH